MKECINKGMKKNELMNTRMNGKRNTINRKKAA